MTAEKWNTLTEKEKISFIGINDNRALVVIKIIDEHLKGRR